MDIFEKPIATIEKKHLPCRAIGAYEEWVRGRAGTLRAALLTDGGHRHPEVARFVEEWADILEALHVGRAAAAEVIRLRALNTTVSIDAAAKRGLAYYTESGFEISVPKLGTQSQVLGGGRYAEGIGFAIGLDRLLLATEKN